MHIMTSNSGGRLVRSAILRNVEFIVFLKIVRLDRAMEWSGQIAIRKDIHIVIYIMISISIDQLVKLAILRNF